MTSLEIAICLLTVIFQTFLYIILCTYKEPILCFVKAKGHKTLEDIESSDGKDIDNLASLEYKECPSYNQKLSFIIFAFVVVMFFFIDLLLIKSINGWHNYIKLVVLTLIVATAGIIDLKTKKIPNYLIMIGVSIRLAVYIYEIIYCSADVLSIFKNDLIGFAIGFGILFVAAIISRGSVGFGDVKLFAVVGLLGGAILTYSTLLISLILNSIFSVIFIIIKRKDRKTAVPFGPAIFVGYLIALCLSSF